MLSYSYSYSDVRLEYGTTNNAAENGLNWDMLDVLPTPNGLMINGMIYQYTTNKDPSADMKVHIQNENALEEGYILRQTDDWSGVPGNTINKVLRFPDIPSAYFGDGSIEVEGEGSVTDPTVIYAYKLDPCFIPLTDPSCPGYLEALYAWLKENGLLPDGVNDINDPFFDQWVQAALNSKTDLQEDEETELKKDEDEEDDDIERLNAGASIEALGDPAAQAAIMEALSTIPNFENYYTVAIQGGVYEEALVLEDKELPDNVRAMRNLAQDSLHRSMVRSQYEN